jgi:hypothetical protein
VHLEPLGIEGHEALNEVKVHDVRAVDAEKAARRQLGREVPYVESYSVLAGRCGSPVRQAGSRPAAARSRD